MHRMETIIRQNEQRKTQEKVHHVDLTNDEDGTGLYVGCDDG